MRILHVTPYAPDAWAYGGIPRVVGTLARGLARRGHDVTVCATDVSDRAHRLARPDESASSQRLSAAWQAWPATRTADDIDLRIFPNVSNRLAYEAQLFLPVGLAAYLRRHAADFDVAHLHACRNVPGAIAARELRRAGVPYLLSPNGTAPRLERRKVAKAAWDLVVGRRMLAGAARVLAVSEAERGQLARIGVDADAIHLLPNPLDLDEFATPVARGAFRRRFDLGSERLVVFLGKLTPRKRVDVLIRAFASFPPNARLVIAGNDMGAGPALRALVGTLGLTDPTLFTGLLQGHARLELLADADVVVYPCEDEIFGLVALEALLCGTPVVVSDDSGCGEIIRGTGGGLVTPLGDSAAVAAAICEVLRAPDQWRAAATVGAERVRTLYGSEAVSALLEGVYTRVLRHEGHEDVKDMKKSYKGKSSERSSQNPLHALHAFMPLVSGEQRTGVSFIVPVRGAGPWLSNTLDAILSCRDRIELEIIIVDDNGRDEDGASSATVRSLAEANPIRIIAGRGRGAAAAINAGIRAAQFPIVCQIDQDVVISREWLDGVLAGFADPTVAAVQGCYASDPRAGFFARVMGLDLEQRYDAIASAETTHVCTGNTAYRAGAFDSVGLFDESLGYGYDNDMSYRLRAAGHTLAICRSATSAHRWREGVTGYLVQQYGFGYGRLDLVAKHPARWTGDSVSGAMMMAHPIALATAIAALAGEAVAYATGAPWQPPAIGSAVLVAALVVERLWAGLRAARRYRVLTPLAFPVVHLIRDLAWVAAISVWTTRRLARRASNPRHSMRPRPAAGVAPLPERPRRVRAMALIPAHNEAANLPSVIAELRAAAPSLEIVVIDDGSTDGTAAIADRLAVRSIRLPERMGIGSAMRAGLRYARRLGYDIVVRLDGDGQHRADDIARLLRPIHDGTADVVLGSRYTTDGPAPARPASLVRRALGVCISTLTGRRVTDPTSGFCAFGPRAVRLLAEHHPTGYPEPELRLFLSRNRLTVVEVPVRERARLTGASSLTPGRLTAAGARVLLAMIIVPLRGMVGGADRD